MRRRFAVSALCLSWGLLAAGCTGGAAREKFVIFFPEWSATLDAGAESTILTAASWAKQHPSRTVTVRGYAAPEGSVAANVELSRARAQVVADALVGAGVPPAAIARDSHGPVDFTDTALESRRVEIAIADH
jgi:outer membrane protein OmpA-like peptidoglycan-associated protein